MTYRPLFDTYDVQGSFEFKYRHFLAKISILFGKIEFRIYSFFKMRNIFDKMTLVILIIDDVYPNLC